MLLILASFISCSVVRVVILAGYEKRAVDVRTAEIQNQCTILSNQLNKLSYLTGDISEQILAEVQQLTSIYSGRVMLVDGDFKIIQDTYDIDIGKTLISGDVIRCFQGLSTSHYDAENRFIEVTWPVKDEVSGEVGGVILVSISADQIVDSLTILNRYANVGTAIILLFVAISAIVYGITCMRPFRRITRSIEAVTEGYVDEYLHEETYEETRLLSGAFNTMLGRLKALDVTSREFVSNVSHELKTPLTSMKVLADSLLSQPDAPVEMYREFMGDLSAEIERENDIIDDLLSLVKLDKDISSVNIKRVNVNAFIEHILKFVSPIADTAKVELIYESERQVTAEIDSTKLSLAISNIVENAVKYNRNNGGYVRVTLDADHKFFYIEIEDNGIGIPTEHQDRIFERFYRVDKSHSREIGGTGLGLSIARTAIVLHRGSVKVESEVGKGTKFIIRIPLAYAKVPPRE